MSFLQWLLSRFWQIIGQKIRSNDWISKTRIKLGAKNNNNRSQCCKKRWLFWKKKKLKRKHYKVLFCFLLFPCDATYYTVQYKIVYLLMHPRIPPAVPMIHRLGRREVLLYKWRFKPCSHGILTLGFSIIGFDRPEEATRAYNWKEKKKKKRKLLKEHILLIIYLQLDEYSIKEGILLSIHNLFLLNFLNFTSLSNPVFHISSSDFPVPSPLFVPSLPFLLKSFLIGRMKTLVNGPIVINAKAARIGNKLWVTANALAPSSIKRVVSFTEKVSTKEVVRSNLSITSVPLMSIQSGKSKLPEDKKCKNS